MQTIYLAAGCFWGVEEILRKISGITATEVGYANGVTENPSYQEVCTGTTNHAEVVKLEFDETIISLSTVLDYFFRLHDPTTLNRQHNDVGTQYRSGVFCTSEEQLKATQEFVDHLERSHKFTSKIVTQVEMLKSYYSAELYHQKYLIKNPDGYMCHILKPSL